MKDTGKVLTPAWVRLPQSFSEDTVFRGAYSQRRDRWIGFIIASLIHALVLWVGNLALVKPVQYGVEVGMGGIEVSLVAAPVQEEISQVLPSFQENRNESVVEEDVLSISEPEPAKVVINDAQI